PEVTDVDAKDGNARAAKTVGGLQQGAVAAAADHQVRSLPAEVAQFAKEIWLRRNRLEPFLPHPFPIKRGPQRAGRLFRVRLRPVDDDDDLVDFHVRSPEEEQNSGVGSNRNWRCKSKDPAEHADHAEIKSENATQG